MTSYIICLFFLCSDPEAVLKKVQKIEELIATIEGLAKETEVGADQWHCSLPANDRYQFHAECGHVQGVCCLPTTQFGG